MVVEYSGPDTGGAVALVQGFHFPVDVNCSNGPTTGGQSGQTCAAPEGGELVFLHPGFKASFIHDASMDGRTINYEEEYWGTVVAKKGLNVSVVNPQPSTLTPQTATLNPQPSTLNPQSSTLNPQPSTLKPQPSTLNPQPATLNP